MYNCSWSQALVLSQFRHNHIISSDDADTKRNYNNLDL